MAVAQTISQTAPQVELSAEKPVDQLAELTAMCNSMPSLIELAPQMSAIIRNIAIDAEELKAFQASEEAQALMAHIDSVTPTHPLSENLQTLRREIDGLKK